jgi:hypothetical protein
VGSHIRQCSRVAASGQCVDVVPLAECTVLHAVAEHDVGPLVLLGCLHHRRALGSHVLYGGEEVHL